MYHQLWFVQAVSDASVPPYDTQYTIRNLRSGTYMDLANTTPYANGATLIGRARGGASQHWFIRPDQAGTMRICNCVTETYIDLNEGISSKGAVISGWDWVGYGQPRYNQLWNFERVSTSSKEIRQRLEDFPSICKELQVLRPDGIYLIVPPAIIQNIHSQNGLGPSRCKRGLFEEDDFAFVLKAAIATWGDQNLRADGFGLHCGIIFVDTEKDQRGHAVNWTLSSHRADASLLLVEPQDGGIREIIPDDCRKVHVAIF
ncbi:hypothetical protein EUX98_g7776 [Antrodiella citrinella]|uniref:Ricin B lectin domain-containing protein n=1 Tax=Antrodiella citrinella TaxID=2447956 RepID=A0A4S4MKR0_9APHY|nr:hypothetical protein EUX98_g7776 [Antrodiella citrinella]